MSDTDRDDAPQLIEPFDIDDGAFVATDPRLAFVLGAEWMLIRQVLDWGVAFVWTIHAVNASRLKRMCIRRRRRVRCTPIQVIGQGAPTWATLMVADPQGNMPECCTDGHL